jgi:ABC-type polysaccharide/polyol phosphate export permease
LWAVLMFGFVAGLSQVLAIANVYFRDLGHIISVALQLLFYASPIIFQPTQIPLHYHGVPIRSIIMSNPVSQFVEIFRDISYSLTWGSLGAWGYVAAWTVAMVVLARWIYLRNGRDLGEQV